MDERTEHATNTLRFIERQLVPGTGPYGRFLQQQWLIWDKNGVATYEWRDVPLFVHEGRPEDKNESAG